MNGGAVDIAAALAEITQKERVDIGTYCDRMITQADHALDEQAAVQQPALKALAEQVRTSRTSLATIRQQLEQFSAQLTTASTNIQKLQDRSHSLSDQLAQQQAEASELAQWLETCVVPPSVVRLLRDTPVEKDLHGWVHAAHTIETCLQSLNEYEAKQNDVAKGGTARAQANAVAEQSKYLAITKIYPYLLSLFEPIRTSVTTTLPILQFSVLLPHNQPLYEFLAMHAPRIAAEVQLAYINAARLYYETAFRRYTRELQRILQRWTEPSVLVADAPRHPEGLFALDRLQYAQPTASATALMAYQGEDTHFHASPEHVFHTLAWVFFDTACSEYAFLARFFAGVGMKKTWAPDAAMPTESMLSLSEDEAQEHKAIVTRETWRQVMEPAMQAFADFRKSMLALPHVPLLSHLTMVTLTQELMRVAQARHCLVPELESALMQHVLETWPLVAKALDTEVDAMKHLSVGPRQGPPPPRTGLLELWGAVTASSTDLTRSGHTSQALLHIVTAYAHMYRAIAQLSSSEHEGMLMAGLTRIHAEMARLLREYATNTYPSHKDGTPPDALCMQIHDALAVRIFSFLTLQAHTNDTLTTEAAAWRQLAEQLRT